jgi:hypothetical protein
MEQPRTLHQVTEHFPPCTTFVPDQKKALMIFSKAMIIHGGKSMLMTVYTEIEDSVVLIRVSRPVHCSKQPFQIDSLSATLSTKGCSDALGNFFND